jgi:hypothetical protein
MHTKSQLREGARVLLSAMKYLETVCRDQDVDPRPWVSGDHPLSMAHWILAQHRFRITSLRRCSRAGDPKCLARSIRGFTTTQNARAGHSTSEVRP